jgi:hypothetical protein
MEAPREHPMKNASPEVDACIERAAPLARPILRRLRRLFHAACPDVQETMKWGAPHCERRGIIGSRAAFQGRGRFGFRRGRELEDPSGIRRGAGRSNLCASKISSASQLPGDAVLRRALRAAAALDAAGPAAARPRPRRPRKEAAEPADLLAALRANRRSEAVFLAFGPSRRREDVEWIVEARKAEIRARRIRTAVEWMAEGKPRHRKHR